MLKDVLQPSSRKFLKQQEAAFARATAANVEHLAAHPGALERLDIAPHYRRAAEEVLAGNPVTPARVEELSHMGTSDAPPGV